MSLPRTIADALRLTYELRASLEADDLAAWDDLLVTRAQAMAEFQRAHRCADEAENVACRTELLALQAADRDLQELAEQAMTMADTACRDQLGAAPNGPSVYQDDSLPGSVNRRA